MSYVRKVLNHGEKVVHIGELHWVIFLPGIIFSIAGGAYSVFTYDFASFFFQQGNFADLVGRIGGAFALVFTLLGLFLLINAFVRQASTELAITDRRIIAKYGFISRATYEIMVNRITGVNFDQTILGRILGYGTILVHGAGGDISPFDGIADPQNFQEALMDVIQKSTKAP